MVSFSRVCRSVVILVLGFALHVHAFSAPRLLPSPSHLATPAMRQNALGRRAVSLHDRKGIQYCQWKQPRSRKGQTLAAHMHMEGEEAFHVIMTFMTTGCVPPSTPVSQCLFLASNVVYFAGAVAVCRNFTPIKLLLAGSMGVTGMISFAYHFSQCAFGTASPVTHSCCFLDWMCSVSSAVVFASSNMSALAPISQRQKLGWAAAVLCFLPGGSIYPITHSLWHLITALLAIDIVRENDARTETDSARGLDLSSVLDKVQNIPAVGKRARDPDFVPRPLPSSTSR